MTELTTKLVLLDILRHTSGLGIMENIKINGNENETVLDAITTNASRTDVILKAKLHERIHDFDGEFGMGNLGLLSSLLKLSDYAGPDAEISILREERNGVNVPTTLVFKNESGSKDQYRFMSKDIVDQVMKTAKFKGAEWKLEFNPVAAKVQQLSEAASVYTSVEPRFKVKTENGSLVFEIGSTEGGIVGRREFAENIEGEFNSSWSYTLNTVLSILRLGMGGVCTMRFGEGICQIDVDSGIGVYSYIMPANAQGS